MNYPRMQRHNPPRCHSAEDATGGLTRDKQRRGVNEGEEEQEHEREEEKEREE